MMQLNIVQIMLLGNLILILILLFVKRLEIMSFLFPDKYAYIVMLESDNNISEWIEKKNPDLRFMFNDGFYNMFETINENKTNEKIEKIIKSSSVVYRSGRLASFMYIEGNENPVNLRTLETTGNPQLNKQILKTDISKLFTPDETPLDNLLKYVPLIILFVAVIILIIVINKGNAPAPVK